MGIYQLNQLQSIEVTESSIKIIPTANAKRNTALGVIALKPNFHLRLGIPYNALDTMMQDAATGVFATSCSKHKDAELISLNDLEKNYSLGTILLYKGIIVKYFITHDAKDNLGFSLRRLRLPNDSQQACKLAMRFVRSYTGIGNPEVAFKRGKIIIRVPDNLSFKGKYKIVYVFNMQNDGTYMFESLGYNLADFESIDGDERWEI